MAQPSISLTYFNHFVRYADEKQIDLSKFWAEQGLPPEQGFVPFETLRLFIEFLWSKGCPPSLGLEVGKSIQVSSHGLLGFGLANAKDLDQCLYFVCQYYQTRAQIMDFFLEKEGEFLNFTIKPMMDWGSLDRVIYEALVAILHNVLRFAIGKRVEELTLNLPYEKPDWWQLYKQFIPANYVFSAQRACFKIPMEWLSIQCMSHDPVNATIAKDQCEAELVRIQKQQKVSDQVRHLIESSARYHLSLENAAKALNMSKSTLIRKLKQEQATFKGLLDDIKQHHASHLLLHTEQKLEVIALQLGYDDVSNFNRTFKRWFGCTPATYRLKNQ